MMHSPLRSSLYTILEEERFDDIDNSDHALHPALTAQSCIKTRRNRILAEACSPGRCYTFSRFLSTNALLVLLALVCITIASCIQRLDRSSGRMLSVRGVSMDVVDTRSPKRTLLFDDGTLYMPENGESMCQYFLYPSRSHTEIKRIHYHFSHCQDDSMGNQLSEYFGALVLANAAQVPFTMTCDPYPLEDTVIFRLIGESIYRPSVDIHGNTWSPLDLCLACETLPAGCNDEFKFLFSETIRRTMWSLESNDPSVEIHDAVIHLRLGDALASTESEIQESRGVIPHEMYSDAIKQASLEKGEIKSIVVLVQSPNKSGSELIDHRSRIVSNDFLEYLQGEFPLVTIQIILDGVESSRKTYQRLIQANKVAICGVSSFCTHPVLSNHNGLAFVYQGHKAKVSDWVSTLVEFNANLRVWDVPLLESNVIENISDDELLHWLRTRNSKVISSPASFQVVQ